MDTGAAGLSPSCNSKPVEKSLLFTLQFDRYTLFFFFLLMIFQSIMMIIIHFQKDSVRVPLVVRPARSDRISNRV